MTNELSKLGARAKREIVIIFSVFLLVLILSIIIYVVNSGLNEILVASPRNPWGIITSLFVHGDGMHLIVNMLVLFVYLVLLVVLNMFISKEEITRRVFFSLFLMFFIPMMLNFVWVNFFHGRVMGSSGIGYALGGIFVGFAFINGLELRRLNKCVKNERKILKTFSLFNLISFAFILLFSVLFPTIFFSIRPETNIWIHRNAFYLGFLSVLFYIVPVVVQSKRKITEFTD